MTWKKRADSSVEERYTDNVEVEGSIPSLPTEMERKTRLTVTQKFYLSVSGGKNKNFNGHPKGVHSNQVASN